MNNKLIINGYIFIYSSEDYLLEKSRNQGHRKIKGFIVAWELMKNVYKHSIVSKKCSEVFTFIFEFSTNKTAVTLRTLEWVVLNKVEGY